MSRNRKMFLQNFAFLARWTLVWGMVFHFSVYEESMGWPLMALGAQLLDCFLSFDWYNR